MMGSPRTRFYLRLLFDDALRAAFIADPEGCAAAAGLSEADAKLFQCVDADGLALDAHGRRRYLMSALCRSFPLSAAALGSLPGGPERLAAFLADGVLGVPRPQRAAAFGGWLEASIPRLVPDEETAALIEAFLGWERALVANAAQLREAVSAGKSIPPPEPLSRSRAKRARLGLPPYLVAAQLPCPPAVLRGALEHIGPSDAWQLIAAGRLSHHRLQTVARGHDTPVTFLGRGVVKGMAQARGGAGGVGPLVDISHVTVELTGLRGGLVQRLAQGARVEQLPQEDRRLATELAEAGMLIDLGKQ